MRVVLCSAVNGRNERNGKNYEAANEALALCNMLNTCDRNPASSGI